MLQSKFMVAIGTLYEINDHDKLLFSNSKQIKNKSEASNMNLIEIQNVKGGPSVQSGVTVDQEIIQARNRNSVFRATTSTIIPCILCKKPNKWEPGEYVQGYLYECSYCETPFQHVLCPHCATGQIWQCSKVQLKMWKKSIYDQIEKQDLKNKKDAITSTKLSISGLKSRSNAILPLASPSKIRKFSIVKQNEESNISTNENQNNSQDQNVLQKSNQDTNSSIEQNNSLHSPSKIQKRLSTSQGQTRREKQLIRIGFIEGQVYRCCNRKECGKVFQIIHCPKCKDTINFQDLGFLEGKLTRCPSCKYEFHKVICPHCYISLHWNKDDFDITEIYECPNCSGEFQKIPCSQCSTLNEFIPDVKGEGAYDGKAFECVHCHRVSESLELQLANMDESDSEDDPY